MNCTLIKEDLTKEFIDKGAINPGNNAILDKPLFKQLNNAYSNHIKDTYKLDELTPIFTIENNKAIANDEFLAAADRLRNPEIAHDEKFDKKTADIKTIAARRIEKAHEVFFSKLSHFDKTPPTTKDTINTTEAKIARMQEAFDAEVMIDSEMDASGVLLAANHPVSVRAGKPVIMINPNNLFSDTVFHEFGHLYIDLLGGMQDEVVAQAVEQLRDSKLWQDVAETYPELSDESLAKEVLATALGTQGNDIYNGDVQKESVWQQIKKALLIMLDRLFNTQYGVSAIEKLADEMLSGNVRIDSTDSYNSLIDQYSKLNLAPEDINQANIDKMFKGLQTKYQLDDPTHEYRDTETGDIFTSSVTSFAKRLTLGREDYKYKESYTTDLTDAFEVNKNNYSILLAEPVLPWSLGKAFEAFFNGKVGSGLSYTNMDEDTYWYDFYNEIMADEFIDEAEVQQAIFDNLDVINETAKVLEKEKNKPLQMGTQVHEILEQYINEEITEFPGHLIDTKDGDLLATMKEIIDKGKARGSKFYPEQILFSDSAQKPGTADLVEITKDGKFRIYDFKTTKSFTNKWGEKSDYDMYISPGYMNQLIIYSTILEEYGLSPAKNHLNIVSIEVDGTNFDPDNSEDSSVEVTGVINKNIDPSDKYFTNHYQTAKRKINAEFMNPRKLKKFNLKTKEDKLNDLAEKIQRGIIDYKKLTDRRTGKFTSDTLKDNNKLHKLEEKIEEFIGENNGVILFRYVDNMRDALYNVFHESKPANAMLTPEYLSNVDYLLQTASFIPEVKKFIQELNDDYTIPDVDKQELLELLEETQDIINHVKDMHVNKTRELAVNTLAQNSNFMEGLYSEKYEVEAREQGLTTKEEISEYIYDQLTDSNNKELIQQAEYDYWEGLLTHGYTDIRYFEYLLADPGMNKSQFVQVVKNVLDKVDNDKRIDLDDSIPEIVKWYDDIKFKKTGDPAKVWKKFLEVAQYEDTDGNKVKYTHGSVIPEFTSEYRDIFLNFKYRLDDLNRKINKEFQKNGRETDKIEKLKEAREKLLELRAEKLEKADKTSHTHARFEALSKEEQEALRFVHNKLKEADQRLATAPTKKLALETRDGNYIYTLPKARKSNVEAAHDSAGMIKNFTSGLKDMVRPPADEDELGLTDEEQRDYDDYKTKNTDILGEPSYDVPVFYRNELEDPALQSFDIPTLLAINEETTINYYHHKMIEADLFMITQSLKNTPALKTDAIVSNNVTDRLQDKLPKSLRADDNLTLKAVEASINNRFYSRAYQGSYSKWSYRSIKAAETLSKGTSMLLLSGNFRSGMMTGIQGTIYRMIEGVAGENFSMKDVKAGSTKAYADIYEVIKDTQSQFPKSKTNLLIRRFGLETQYKALVNKFVQDNFITKNLDESAMFAVTTIAETMVTANLMYTLMNNIKVMNDSGDYINKEGTKVAKENAMSLDEAYDVVDGKLVLNTHVAYTERNLNNKFKHNLVGEKTIASTEISRYIRSIYADLYGQYNQDMKSVAEMHVLGKMAFSMRKWIPRGYHRRWRGITNTTGLSFEELRKEENSYKRFYSQDQKKFQEGYYTTGVRFAKTMLREFKDNQLSFMAAAKKVNSTLTTHEHANLKRLAAEFLVIGVSFFSALLLRGIAKAMEDEDDRSQDKIYYALYLLERIKMESATFINPMELIENLKNPAAAVNTMTRLYNLFEQTVGFSFDDDGAIDFAINDTYDRGLRKDQFKITKHLQQLVPWYKNVAQAKGILELDSNETVKDSYEYMIR